MKILNILLILLLCGCGAKTTINTTRPSVDISTIHIEWQGNILESAYTKVFEDTEKCLHDDYGYEYKTNPPTLYILTDKEIICGDTLVVLGGCFDIMTNSIFVGQIISSSGYPVNHEVVHWMTGRGNDFHYSGPFYSCAQ